MPIRKVDPHRGIKEEEPKATRKVVMLGKEIEVRRVPPTKEAIKQLGVRTRMELIGHVATNPMHIERQVALKKAEILRSMAMMNTAERIDFIAKGPIDFVEDKTGLQRYDINCVNCGEKVAYCWAKNDKLEGWCDLHYVSWYDEESWRGAMVVNVSPIDGALGFECACGEDTRDFRATNSLPPIQKRLMVDYILKHRGFGSKDSKFIAVARK